MKIYVKEIKDSGRFSACLDTPDGEIIVANSRQPLLDAARALKARGFSGKLEMWDIGRPYPRMTGDIDRLAGLTIEESDKGGIRVRNWKPTPFGAVRPPAVGKGPGGS